MSKFYLSKNCLNYQRIQKINNVSRLSIQLKCDSMYSRYALLILIM